MEEFVEWVCDAIDRLIENHRSIRKQERIVNFKMVEDLLFV